MSIEDPILSMREEIEAAIRIPTPSSELPVHHENTTDATRGQPLVVRAQLRRAELAAYLGTLPEDARRERVDIELALTVVDGLLTGDLTNISGATASTLNRWLEANKHLARTAGPS